MSGRLYGNVLFVLVVFSLFILGCSDGAEEAATDGDGVADGDSAMGAACTNQSDCPDGATCAVVGEGLICTPLCRSDAECQTGFPGGCCMKVGASYYCAPAGVCGNDPDGDDPDGDIPDGDNPDGDEGPCEFDTYRCQDYDTVDRCGSSGTWTTYKNCSPDTCCYNGECVSADGAVDCESGDLFCIPDSYRCRGRDEVQRCNSDGGDWTLYRICDEGTQCVDGMCISLTDGDDPDGDDPDGDNPDGDNPDGDDPECVPCDDETGCEGGNEYCLTLVGHEEGCCRLLCDVVGALRCPDGYSCGGDGKCQPVEGYCRSDAHCEMSEFCNILPGKESGLCTKYCFEIGEYCPNASYCDQQPDSQNYGRCVYEECVECAGSTTCGAGKYCDIWPGQIEGCCVEMCGATNPCGGQLSCCEDGRCGMDCSQSCDCGGPCPGGYICDQLFCICIPNCPPCPEGEYCDGSTAPNCKPGECRNPLVCGWGLKQCCPGYSCSAIVYGVVGFCI